MPRGDLPSQVYVTGIMDVEDIGESERNLGLHRHYGLRRHFGFHCIMLSQYMYSTADFTDLFSQMYFSFLDMTSVSPQTSRSSWT
jgi:hypothetical protein